MTPVQLDAQTLLLIVVGLCGLAVVAMVVLPLIGTLFDLIGLVGGVLMGDPSSCCGCIVLLGILSVCGMIAAFGFYVYSTCGTPDAMTFCSLFGR